MAEAGTLLEMLPLFRERFPEFIGEEDKRITTYLSLARTIFCKCGEATLYLAAHLLVMANSNGMGKAGNTQELGTNQDAQALESIKVDSKTVSFSKMTAPQDAVYTTTNYGMIFLQLKKACSKFALAMGTAGNES